MERGTRKVLPVGTKVRVRGLGVYGDGITAGKRGIIVSGTYGPKADRLDYTMFYTVRFTHLTHDRRIHAEHLEPLSIIDLMLDEIENDG